MQRVYSRIYNLPQDNVWSVSALPALLLALTVTAVCAACGVRRLGYRDLIAPSVAALLVGSVAFALLPAVRIAPALRVPSETYLKPLILTVAFGAVLLVANTAFPRLAGKAWCAIPIAVLLPEDAIVLGERADQILMSVPVRTSSTFLANSDGTRTAEDILKAKPGAKLYLMADTRHAYNLQNFAKKKDRFVLQPLAKFKMPSFANGKPVDVHLCKINVLNGTHK